MSLRAVLRICSLTALWAGCTKETKDAPRPTPAKPPGDAQAAVMLPADAEAPPVQSDTYPDLATALKAVIPADARVVGFGEIHMRTDRKQVTSSLARFTNDGLPAIADKLSDLIIETWLVDPKCGQKAQTTTAKVEMTVRRPQETKSEIAMLADAAKAAKVQPHAMRITCDDYDKMSGKDGQVDPTVLLTMTTSELKRIASEAVVHRDKKGETRPWIGLYGGALHNDRFPAKGIEEWSYAEQIDKVSKDRYVEVDLIVPELAEADESQKSQPWYGLVAKADDKVHVYKRGDRSFVIVLQKGK